jgi:hypothetical protein
MTTQDTNARACGGVPATRYARWVYARDWIASADLRHCPRVAEEFARPPRAWVPLKELSPPVIRWITARTASFTVPVRVSPGVVVFLSARRALQDLGGLHGHHDPADHHSDHSAHWRRRILRPRSLVLTKEKALARTGAERTWRYLAQFRAPLPCGQAVPFQCRVPALSQGRGQLLATKAPRLLLCAARASGVSPFCATRAPIITPLMATCAPILSPGHTGGLGLSL